MSTKPPPTLKLKGITPPPQHSPKPESAPKVRAPSTLKPPPTLKLKGITPPPPHSPKPESAPKVRAPSTLKPPPTLTYKGEIKPPPPPHSPKPTTPATKPAATVASKGGRVASTLGRFAGGVAMALTPNDNIATDAQEKSELQKFASKSKQTTAKTPHTRSGNATTRAAPTPSMPAFTRTPKPDVPAERTKGGIYPKYEGSDRKKAESFRSEYAGARGSKKKSFEWEGRSYNTRKK